MYRDFSESAKAKLLGYVADVTETKTWGKIGDAITDAGARVSQWLGFLNVSNYVNNLDEYHRKIIDKNNTTAKQIETIFSNVCAIDSRYQSGLQGEKNYLDKIVKLVDDLAQTINPTGGNLDMNKMSAVLEADVNEIQNSRTTVQNIIEDRSLGTEPVATPTSVDPVNLATGNFIYEYRDLSYAGEFPLFLHRYYNSKDNRRTALGKGFRHNFDVFLIEKDGNIDISLSDGMHIHFTQEDGVYVGVNTIGDILEKKENEIWYYQDNGDLIIFNSFGKITRKENANHVGYTLLYENDKLVCVKNDFGDFFKFEYNEKNQLKQVCDSVGRIVKYEYKDGYLISVIGVNNRKINYSYSNNGCISETSTENEKANICNIYDKKGRVLNQIFGDGSSMSFEYNDENSTVVQIERNGVKTVFYHDENYRNTKTEYQDGSCESFVYNDRGLCVKHVDRMGNTERFSYDNRGNLVQKIDAVRRRFNMTYDVHNNLIAISVNGITVLKNHYDKKGNLLSSENTRGAKNVIKYDELGRVVMVMTPDGGVEEYTYDEKGNVSEFKNHFGGVTYYEYDELHRVISVTSPLKGKTQYTYTIDGNVASETNSLGHVRYFDYNEKGLLIKETDYNGNVVEREYDEINRLKTIVNADGGITTYDYDNMWNVSELVEPNGAKTLYKYNLENHLEAIVDAIGNITYFTYDKNGNCLSESRGDVSNKFEYDAVGRKTKITYLNGIMCEYVYDVFDNIIEMTIGDDIKIQMKYDESNNLIEQKNLEGEIRRFTYTADGKINSVEDEYGRKTQYKYVPGENKYESITYPDGNTERFKYDGAGNLIEFIDRAGNVISADYDSSNQLINSYVNSKLMKSAKYDAMGNLISVVDSNGKETCYEYSSKNELIKLTNVEGTVIEYSYDLAGHLLSKTDIIMDERRTTNFEYDLLGRVITSIDPMGYKEVFEYDCFNNLISKKDKDGILTQYSYTSTGKVSKITYQDGRVANISYDKNDYLCEIEDWTGKTIVSNDLSGRATLINYPNGEQIQYSYNTAGKRTAVIYPSGKCITYQYDKLLRLEKLDSEDVSIEYLYDECGRLGKKVSSTGIETQYEYNKEGLLSALSYVQNSDIIDKIEFEYDSYGRKKRVNRERIDDKQFNGQYAYEYDDLGRLLSVERDGTVKTRYQYDAYGNRILKIEDGKEINFKYNCLNQLLSITGNSVDEEYTYDKRGNLISVSSHNECISNYEYSSINRLEKMVNHRDRRTINYKYNAMGYRIQKTIIDEDIQHSESYCIDMTKQYDNVLQIGKEGKTQHFVWDDKLVAINNGKRSYYCMLDDLGSPYRMVNSDGQTVETYNYDEFGQEVSPRSLDINPFTFIGYQRDGQFYFAQAREYMPMAGRFAARDLVSGRVDNINSQNEYLYCEDDPNNFVDKNGLFLITAILVGVAVGAATSAAVNGVSQGIKIAQGKQDSFKWGEFVGSTVEGAIVGGVGAIPGLGPAASLAVKVGGGAVGATANSLISQGIDTGKIDAGKVAEDATAGAVFGAVSFGIDKGLGAIKTKIGVKKPTTTSKSVYKDLDKATGALNKAQGHLDDVINSGHKPSSLTRKTLANAQKDVSDLTKKYFKTWGKEKAMSFVTGKSGILRTSVRTIFGYETVKQVSKKAFKKWLPWYSEGEDDNVLDYLDDYYGTLYGKFKGKCPIYA